MKNDMRNNERVTLKAKALTGDSRVGEGEEK